MYRKILAVMVCMLILCSSISGFAYSPEYTAQLLNNLNIINGYPDGELRLENCVTRAEFTKIAIAASSYRNMVASNMTVSPFSDVPYTHWAAPYIKLAVSNKLITGYADSSFRPDNNVTFEESLSITLKLLGYSSDDFGSSWPYGQVGIANNIGLTKKVTASVGEAMTRGDVATLIFNLLNIKSKNSNNFYIENLNYTIVEDVILIATTKEDSSVGSGKVLTSSGIYIIDNSFDYKNVGKKGDVILKNSNEFVMFVPSDQAIEKYSIYQTLSNDIIVYNNGKMESLDLDTSVTVYHKSVKTTLKGMLTEISAGDIITLYKNANGVLDYATVATDKMIGPITITSTSWQENLGIMGENLTILRDGSKVTSFAIQLNDIVYYSKELSTVWAYSKKITGIYEKALPDKDSLTSIVVSGVTYQVETAAAFNALSSNGSFQYGDTVILLIGKNGSVADVISPVKNNQTVYGYLSGTGKKNYTNANGETYNSYYISLVLADGSVFDYAAKKDYGNYINSIVRVTFSDGIASVTVHTATSDVYGSVDADNYKIGNTPVADNVKILDISTKDIDETGSYKNIYLQRIDDVDLTKGSILYCEKNSKNELSALILNNVTGDADKYGIVTYANNTTSGMNIRGNYTFDIAGTTQSLNSSSTAYSVNSGQPAKFSMSGSSVKGISALHKLDGSIKDVTSTYIETKTGKKFLLSDSVLVYKKTSDYKYMIIPLSEIVENKSVTITAYYDKEQSYGGRIRVIVITG